MSTTDWVGIPAFEVPAAPAPTGYPGDDLSRFAPPVPGAPPVPAPLVDPTPAFEPGYAVPASGWAAAAAAPTPTEPAPYVPDDITEAARSYGDPELIRALEMVLYRGGSDLHIAAGAPPMIRIDGALEAVSPDPWDRERVAAALYGLLTDEFRDRFDTDLELDFAFTLSENARFRVNYFLQRGAIGAAFRLIPREIRTLEDLGVPASVSSFAGLPRGLVLVTGPTGSGKSTTLAALLDLVNRTRADHIVTIEDPIEFLHPNKRSLINQREVGADTRSFATALRQVLRQDPDVILIGELRDLETISVALTAAETGHLVFATLHTQDAGQTVDRIIDVFPPHQQAQVRAQLATTLQGIVCQTLVPKATGAGRVVATEVLVATPAIGNLIREGKTFQIRSTLQSSRAQGMHTLDQHLADLVRQGQITMQAALEKARDTAEVSRLIDPLPRGTARR